MSTYRLNKLFSPRSVAIVGGSPRETSPGRAVLRNLRDAAFKGSIGLVNAHYNEIEGIRAVKTIRELPEAPDLLVIAAPPQSVPGIVSAAGEKGAATSTRSRSSWSSSRSSPPTCRSCANSTSTPCSPTGVASSPSMPARW
jgi:acetyltransferase